MTITVLDITIPGWLILTVVSIIVFSFTLHMGRIGKAKGHFDSHLADGGSKTEYWLMWTGIVLFTWPFLLYAWLLGHAPTTKETDHA